MPTPAVPTTVISIEALLAHRGWVRALAMAIVRDPHRADDLVQQTWVRALESPPTRAETVRGWLATIVRNLARDAWRAEARRAGREALAVRPDHVPASDELVARAEAHRHLILHVTRLREPFRTVVLLRYFEDLPPRAIATRLGVPAETVRSRLHRGRALLRGSLATEGRSESHWLATLLPVLGGPPPFVAPHITAHVVEGLIVTTKQKIIAAASALLLLCGGGAWMALSDRRPPSPAAQPAVESADAPATPGGPADTRRRVAPPAPVEQSPPPEAEATPRTEPVVPPPVAPSQPDRESLSFTILRHVAPREVPKGYTELQPGEEPVIDDTGPAMGASGPRMLPYWSRWARVPEAGSVTVRGRIIDASGRGIEGAEVFRVKLDGTGHRASPSSFQWVRKIATTGPDGSYEARGLPAASFLVAADWNATMRRSRGLDIGTAVPVTAGDDETLTGIDVRLPIETARLARVTGIVIDENGEPTRNVEVNGPFQRVRTDAAGRFAMRGLQPGAVTLSTRSTGYATARVTLDLVPGAAEDVEFQLELAEPGDLTLVGRVLDEQDVPVVGVAVFLAASRDGSRWATTDERGDFRFERLPAKYAKTPVNVMVSPHPERDLVKPMGPPQEITVPTPNLTLRVRRSTRLHVLLRDKESGEPLPLFAIQTQVEEVVDGAARWRSFHSLSRFEPSGEATFVVPRGRFRLVIRAKDHRGVEVEVDLPDALTPKEIRVDLERE